MIRTQTVAHVACLIVIATAGATAHAQVGPDPVLFDQVAKLEPGQSLQVGNTTLTLNQRKAGKKDATGWYLTSSVSGGFSARFPAPVNEETILITVANGPDHMKIEEHALLSEKSKTRFALTCAKVGELKASAQNIDEIVKMIESHSTQFKSERFTGPTHEGIQYSGIDEKGVHFAGQSFLLDSRYCQFLVGGAPFDGIPPEARTWFESFRPVVAPAP
jgi:hypothetical protein